MSEQRGFAFYGSVTVSERGQIVIPAQVRRDLDIQIGEKLLVVSGPGGQITLLRASTVGRILNQWNSLVPQLQEAEIVEAMNAAEEAK